MNWRKRVLEAKTLTALCDALNEMEAHYRNLSIESESPPCVLAGITENELCDLPTFGGEPIDQPGIYSWDATRVLVYDYVWKLELRDEHNHSS